MDCLDKIDFVISWVDSADPEWQQKKQAYSGKKVVNSSNGDERFRDYGTLRYLLRSIERYANWVNHIYLVTDHQRPSWLSTTNSRLTVIDHQEIIPSTALPTFNSNAIDFCLDQIPGLSEQFVYFNDDCLINKDVSPTDFFKDGLPCDFRIYSRLIPNSDFDFLLFNNILCINQWLKGRRQSFSGMLSRNYRLRGNIKNLIQIVRNGARVSNYVLYHNAYSFTKSEYRAAREMWQQRITQTVNHRFRTRDDVTIYLLRYFRLEKGAFAPRSPKFDAYYTLNQTHALINELAHSKHHLVCVNDADTTDYAQKKTELVRALDEKFAQHSDFER
ncbi:capsule biosynthesis protein CapC [Lactiplantibacillus pentosus]|uniref:Capsule biosynthesis protein CapC n=1 Tax=Lactiplantibacillus pentosus TaxID=1589 RepID=A0ABX5CU11_LACPE|nr:capsule biosynthesis protein CapC [Lactiplantibacillus pentosus]